MSHPRISVCVATYNQCRVIEKCLRSIFDQEVDATLHVIVGDDASTDGTSQIIENLAIEYGSQLQHIRRISNIGPFANLRDLLARADGDFISRVDGDDFWLPGKLAAQVDYLATHAQCSAVYTNAVIVDEAGTARGVFNDVGDERLNLAALLRRGNVLNNSSVLFRAVNLESWLREFDQIDYQVHLSQAQRGWLGHIGEPFAAYRVRTNGSLVAESHARVRELYWQAIESVPRELVSDADYARGLTDFLRRVFFRSVRTCDPKLFREWASRVYEASPYGCVRTTLLSAHNIIRMASKISAGQFRRSGRRRVLYRW